MKLFERRALLGLLAGVCALAFPGVAAAAVNPTLTLTPGSTTTAGASGATLGWDLKFVPSSPNTDTVSSFTQNFPAGLLADSTINNYQCLVSSSDPTNTACEVGTGTATITGAPQAAPAAEVLEPAPNPATDVAGVALFLFNGTSWQQVGNTGDITVRPSDAGLNITIGGLPSAEQVTDLNLTLTHLRLPSSCSPMSITGQTTSAQGANESFTSNSITPTGCPSQAFAPQVTAHVNALPNGGAEVIASITQNANEAASKSIELDLPAGLQANLLGDAGCLQGTPCQIGTASATTPLAPPQALANGTVTLGGTLVAPTMTVSFPAPYALSFVGAVNTGNNSVLVQNVPDVPITSLSLDIKNTPFGQAFNTNCAPGSIVGKFTGQGGQSFTANAPISYSGCSTPPPPPTTAGSPTGSGHVSGLTGGHPQLHLRLSHGNNAADLSKVTIGLGRGLKFSSKGLVKRCTGHGHHRKCSTKAKGLTVSGAIKSVKLVGGKLVITLKHPVAKTSLTIHGPLLSETKGLQKKAKKHKAGELPVTIKVTDASGNATAIPLRLKG